MFFPTALSVLSLASAALAAPAHGNGIVRRSSGAHKRSVPAAGPAPALGKRCANDSSTLSIDDAETDALSYTGGGWTHSSYMTDAQAHHGTLSFSSAAKAGVKLTTPAGATGVVLYSSLKADRGSFSVFQDGKLVGNGTQHDAAATEQTATKAVWAGNVTGKHEISFVSTGGKGTYFAVDYVEVTGTNVSVPETGSGSGSGSATTTASAPGATGTSGGNGASTSSIQGYYYGANSYYLYSLSKSSRIQVLDAMQQAGFKTIRIFVTAIAAGNKGSDNTATPDLEPKTVGAYDDTILESIDQLMVDASARGMKLIIALGDRYALGFWDTDAYAYKFGIVSGGSGAQQVANAANFYLDSGAVKAYDNRIAHIMQHKNKLMGNKAWSQLSEAIYAFEPQNEPMGHMSLVSDSWVCDRAKSIKSFTGNSGILTTSGGGITLQDSLQGWAEDCDAIDIIAVHDYGTDASSTVSALQAAQKKYKASGKVVLFEEWGATGGNKADTVGSFVSALKGAQVPWMYWEVVNPGQASANFEVWTNEPSWSKLQGGGDAKGSKKRATVSRRSQASRRNPTPAANVARLAAIDNVSA